MHRKSQKKQSCSNINIVGMIAVQKFKEYKNKILNKFFNKVTIKPLMKYREIETIEEILENFGPAKCLEWGGGYSTLHFPAFLDSNAKWFTVEHDKHWAAKIQQMNKNPNVKIFNIEPNHFPWTDSNKDGAYSDLKDYIEFPAKFGSLDFILVDGRARKDCLLKALSFIKDEGIVILHDANRKNYHEGFLNYKYQILFENYRKNSHGLWIGSKGMDIHSVLNVDKYRKLWQIYNKIGRIIHKRRI